MLESAVCRLDHCLLLLKDFSRVPTTNLVAPRDLGVSHASFQATGHSALLFPSLPSKLDLPRFHPALL